MILEIWGGKPLSGCVRNSGSKNASLPILYASLMFDKLVVLTNVPDIGDIETTFEILRILNVPIQIEGEGGSRKIRISSESLQMPDVNSMGELISVCKKNRYSLFLLVLLLFKFGEAEVGLPGGCAIGSRPITVHLDGLRQFGAEITVGKTVVSAKMPYANSFRPCNLQLAFPSVTGTEMLIIAAAAASGKSIIRNSAQDPEIVDLCNFLNSKGAKITGHGSSKIEIHGNLDIFAEDGQLDLPYRIMPDTTEAVTYLVAAAVTKGKICITDCQPNNMVPVINLLREMGVLVETFSNDTGSYNLRTINATDAQTICKSFETSPFPGISTDFQPLLTVLNCVSKGTCRVVENLFESRLLHVKQLEKMGAKIHILSATEAKIFGPTKLVGANVHGTDLRAGAALILAGLAARGKTRIDGMDFVHRGYEHLDKKLISLGANLKLCAD